jgi:glycosyltransferase involved in cell wall biosynthesis
MLRANQKIQAFVTPTQFMRRKLIEFGYPPEKIAHIPTPIDAEPIAPQFDGGRYFLYAGNLNPHKGIAVLLEAMRRCPEAQLKIAGQSTEGADLEIQDCIARRGLANVEFLGFRSGAELADLYRNALALVAPALWYENMPNAVLEAMAYGKPIVSSNLGSMPELVEDGLNGRLVPPGDAQALAEAIAALARDPEAAAAMGKASRHKALREHSVESHYARLLALFRWSMGQPIEPKPASPSESNKP